MDAKKEAEFKEALTEVLAPVRKEDGCLFYNLHAGVSSFLCKRSSVIHWKVLI